METLRKKIINEALRIEEDVDYSARSHFRASNRWAKYHLRIGLPTALITALSGGAYFIDYSTIAILFAATSTGLITTLTFLKPSERSELHKTAGNQYLTLRNETRVFREIEIESEDNLETSKFKIIEIAKKRNELNQQSPAINQRDYIAGKSDIEQGRSTHQIDSNK